jgi:hypothetical protein
LITDTKNQMPVDQKGNAGAKRQKTHMEKRLVELSKEYGMTSRAMSLVAVVKRQGDAQGKLPTTQVVPVGLPQDVEMEGYFGGAVQGVQSVACCLAPSVLYSGMTSANASCQPSITGGLFRHRRSAVKSDTGKTFAIREDTDTVLLELAAAIQPDGRAPGQTGEVRVVALRQTRHSL